MLYVQKVTHLFCKLLGIFSFFFQAIDIAQEVHEGYYTSLFTCH